LLYDESVVPILEHEDERHRYDFANHIQEEYQQAITEHVLFLEGDYETKVCGLDEVKDQAVRIRNREHTENDKQLNLLKSNWVTCFFSCLKEFL
jgi:hypothetical protein